MRYAGPAHPPLTITARLLAYTALSLLALPVLAHAANRSAVAPSGSTYVYVGSYDGSAYTISGFSVAADGSAQSVPGSPFSLPGMGLISSGNHLFADDQQNIFSYSVGSNGALTTTSEVNGLAYIQDPGDQHVSALNIDRTGRTLNSVDTCGSCNSEVLPWMVGSDGQLSYIGGPTLPDGPAKWQGVLTFSTDDRFAYTPISQDFGTLQRNSNGTLTWIRPGAVVAPPLPNPQQQVCNISTVAASTQGYITLAWYGGGLGCNAGGYVLGNYTVASNGALNFVPGSQVTPVVRENAMAFDATGAYLAIAGNGIQILQVRADGRTTVLSAPVQVQGLNYVMWDGAGHVYAVGDGLYIFNFNGHTLTQAPGSPYVIANPVSLAVVPGS